MNTLTWVSSRIILIHMQQVDNQLIARIRNEEITEQVRGMLAVVQKKSRITNPTKELETLKISRMSESEQ